MRTSTIRVSQDVQAAVRELAADSGLSMGEVVGRAIEAYATERFFDNVDAAYARLRADPEAWAEELEERRFWDAVVADRPDREGW